MHVPVISIIFMAITAVVIIGLAVALLIIFRKKGASFVSYFIGCGVFLVFALILVGLVHQVVLNTPFGEKIQNTVWLYALYGGFMAGLFEETGRFVAFLTVMKKQRSNDMNALMYGAGHGGFEAVVLVGLSMISNIVISVMINMGMAGEITKSLSGDTLAQIQTAFDSLVNTPSYMFLLGLIERLSAIATHISLSVIVWFAVKNRKWFLYPLAILLHMALDSGLVLMQGAGLHAALIEVILAVCAAVIVLIAVLVWKMEHKEEQPTEPQTEASPSEEANS